MDKIPTERGRKPLKLVFIGVEMFFVLLTMAAFANQVFNAGWGLGWSTFFVSFIISVWGAVAYPLCGQCFRWTKVSS
ncbi:hypothetical protein [Novosphingobium album (ex Hu et al. 2023)]|uniref:DUF2798 domain-containing protein n=1 Tax=Novosphingobium album (ex Hu et al. 2023) TaxID=2930093 RepID=A0ABT0AZC9_9SPHN|nr:hypothetical protein [Novosphingobium album (ex Hu et al. 2023)]MCJ2178005.1 hypothetical protein [Novosphingobium album (ex Hu et al. 2023)]